MFNKKMDVDLLLSEALGYLRQKKFDDALNRLNKIIEIDPNYGLGYFWKAKAYEAWMLEDKPIKTEADNEFGIIYPPPEDDYRLKEIIKSYEKAIELLSEDKNVFRSFTRLSDLTTLDWIGWDIRNRIIDKWLWYNKDDISAWYEKAENAKIGFNAKDNVMTNSIAIDSYKKVVDLIESVYPCQDFCSTYFDMTVKIIESPNKMVEEYREYLDSALLELVTILAENEENYEEAVKYFWKLYWINDTVDRWQIVDILTSVILGGEKLREPKLRHLKEMEHSGRKLGFTAEQHRRWHEQNLLVDLSVQKLKIFITRKLKDKHGATWWDNVPINVKEDAIKKKAIDNRHPDKPKRNELDCLDISDFGKIMKGNWGIFEENFGSREFIDQEIIDPLSYLRNIVKHNSRLLEDREIKELEIIVEKIEKCTMH